MINPTRRDYARLQTIGVGFATALLPLAAFAQATAAPAPASAWSHSVSLAVKETFDSNVYMQKVTPLADQESFVTAITPSLGLSWKPCEHFTAALNYSPEAAFYHSESTENYVAHKGALNLSGKFDTTTWELLNSVTLIDGDGDSPTFFGPGGGPALGGVPLRDRRDATIYRQSFKLQHPIGEHWFVRPVATLYLHDFQTRHQASVPGSVYANYVDRSDFAGGLDLGYKVTDTTWAVLGYRYGYQGQATALANTIEYSNYYQRVLAGVEGKPFDWLKLSVLAGPDFRNFGDNVPAAFDDHHTKFYLDASATITPTKSDTITLSGKRFEQPGYGGGSVYEDVAYELAWRHKFNAQLTFGAGFRVLHWDFSNVTRNEWWYSPNAMVGYAFNKHWSSELTYSYDNVDSREDATEGREAKRHLVSLGIKYTL